MGEGISRRDFIKAGAIAGAVVMGAKAVGGFQAFAKEGPKLMEAEKVAITVLTDNYYDCLRPHQKIARRYMILPGTSLHAEHGLSYFIQVTTEGKVHSFMFDYGLDPRGVSNNIKVLGLDLKQIEAMGLSHGHFDHFGSLLGFLKEHQSEIKKGIPFYVGEEAFSQRFVNLPEGPFLPRKGMLDLGQLKKEELEALQIVKVVEVKEPTPIVPGAYLTGNIERVTEYEKGSPLLVIKRGDKVEQDMFPGEQSLVFSVKGKGLVVLSSCAHAGIVNTVRHAQKITGIEKVFAVIGGFHLSGAKPEVIQRTVADIKAINPEFVVPMHCTGFEAVAAFQREMPEKFIMNTVGTTYLIEA